MKIASHRIVAAALVLTMSIAGTGLPLPAAAAGKVGEASKEVRKADTLLAGKLMVAGAATINGKKALSGTTIFSENRIAVANTAGNQALINLGQLGRIDLAPGTELVLRLANGLIGGELLAEYGPNRVEEFAREPGSRATPSSCGASPWKSGSS